MSMHYGREEGPIYAGETVKQLGNIPLFIYHIPVDEALIDKLLDNSRVRVSLIGNNKASIFITKVLANPGRSYNWPVSVHNQIKFVAEVIIDDWVFT